MVTRKWGKATKSAGESPSDWREVGRKRLEALGVKPDPEKPTCPKCNGEMVLRNGANGKFWGCKAYPTCRGTKNPTTEELSAFSSGTPSTPRVPPAGFGPAVKAFKMEPIVKMPGSREQELIWEMGMKMSPKAPHIVVKAYAGTGKTFTMIQLLLRLPGVKAAFIAFNKHIAVEAQGKLRASGCNNVTCSTYHSLGLRSIKAAYPKVEIKQHKLDDICESIEKPYDITQQDWRSMMSLVKKLCGFSKNYLLNPEDPDFFERLETIADHHGVDLNGVGKAAIVFVPQALRKDLQQVSTVIDFDDMIWAPVIQNLTPPVTYDLLIVDEFQDSNRCQQDLALQCCPSGRVIIVGDPFQSMYAFRGADITAMPNMTERLGATKRGVVTLPLTVTRRCPKKHVKLVQSIVPDFKALDDAPEGEIFSTTEEIVLPHMKVGDMILCRVNAPLVKMAYALIRKGIKAIIRGRDIGEGLTSLIAKLEKTASTLPDLVTALADYRKEEMARLIPLGDKAAGRLSALADKCDCLLEMVSGVKSIADLKVSVENLFKDFEADGRPAEAVILGTVHRTKGLEAERIFILSPELIPHPAAKQEWEHAQEANLAYVAGTRCKFDLKKNAPGTLVFLGPVPSIYNL